MRWHHTAQGTGVSKEFRAFFSTTGSSTLTELVLCVSQEKNINPEFRETWACCVGGFIYLTVQTVSSAQLLFNWNLHFLALSICSTYVEWKRRAGIETTESYLCFQEGKGDAWTVDALMESREEEPVLQRCEVATDNRNWNGSLLKPLPCCIKTLTWSKRLTGCPVTTNGPQAQIFKFPSLFLQYRRTTPAV